MYGLIYMPPELSSGAVRWTTGTMVALFEYIPPSSAKTYLIGRCCTCSKI
jgi:hypothetical protein